tara:strand:+ start:982 stop:1665 length:684 start_codon:yes stop_codon:yes gene_type:complete
MSKITGSRLLRKSFEPAVAGLTGDGWILSVPGQYELYTNNSGVVFAVVRGYFDIEGWSREDLTAFINGAAWQECDTFTIPDSTIGTSPVLRTWDLVSKSFIANSCLEDTHWAIPADATGWSAPGMAGSNYNLEEIFAGRQRSITPDNTTGYSANQVAENLWGAGDATAGDKIYITRIVLLSGLQTLNGLITLPAFNVIVPATLAEEKDLVYMERLRRSYVLAESRQP